MSLQLSAYANNVDRWFDSFGNSLSIIQDYSRTFMEIAATMISSQVWKYLSNMSSVKYRGLLANQ